ncbi:mitochondrial matrix iron-sulfur protein [Claviceps sorghi]|nr:mitochondrial matrix iron-sulfur protein [Claviceps sorghi]
MASASRTLVSRLATLPATACRRAQQVRTSQLLSLTPNPTCQMHRRSTARRTTTHQSLFRPQRAFSTTQAARHGHVHPPNPGEELYVTFVEKDGQEHKFAVSAGDNLLDIAQANDLEMEGACGGSCACSTCHVIVADEDYYDKMPEPEDDENDMLDLAFGLTETSRLGCQVKMTKELDGLVVKLPSMTRNLQASDFK